MTRYNLPVMYDNLERHEERTVREQYVREQQGRCHHCKMPLDEAAAIGVTSKSIMWRLFPQGFLDHPVHLHHDHGNGLTIGAVHAYCNAVLWQYYGV